ncbi:MAG: Asp-tRNA(Asn)/Glu-tRNA(Gln) amidotransferase subunit GatA [Pseudomonadota bacterium]
MTASLRNRSVADLRTLLDKKEISSRELTQSFLVEIEKKNPKLNAFLTVAKTEALEQADAADRLLQGRSPQAPLAGIPIAIKDNILVQGLRATAGSKFLEKFISPYDSTVAKRLRDQGAVFLGKTNLDEFGMGSSNENSAYGPVRNPWDPSCVPGGSSGGSAAALAARMTPLALGTDTGGSVRFPAALCNVVGLKPTYGRVSRYGIVAFASSLDQVGPMARTVGDTQTLFETIAGHDPLDSTSAPLPVAKSEITPIRGLKIGYPKEYLPKELSPEVRENFLAALKVLEKSGATVAEISLPHTDYGIACYYIIAPAEASANLARYDGVRYSRRTSGADGIGKLITRSRSEGFGAEVRRRILIGTFVLSSGYYDAYYLKAQKVRTLIRKDFSDAFRKVDVIATPTSPTPAFKIGSKTSDPLEMYLSDVFTVTISVAGLPALVVPAGFTKQNLPLGLQFVGKPFEEGTLFRAGRAFEAETRYFEKEPS